MFLCHCTIFKCNFITILLGAMTKFDIHPKIQITMKNLNTIARSLLLASVLTISLNLFSSCDGCSRSSGTNNEGTETGNSTNGDTRGSEKSGENEGSGSTEGTNSSSGTKSDR